MMAVNKMPRPLLMQETAQRWQFAGEACPECHGAIYHHAALASLQLGYKRCPSCKMNFVQLGAIIELDRLADALLDRAAIEFPALIHPSPKYAKHDPKTNAVDPCETFPPWKG